MIQKVSGFIQSLPQQASQAGYFLGRQVTKIPNPVGVTGIMVITALVITPIGAYALYKLAQAFSQYRKAAAQKAAAQKKEADALYHMAICYFIGRDVKMDNAKAFAHYFKAARLEHVEAQGQVAFCYHHGYGVEKDPAEAIKYYRMAADNGDASSQLQMGRCYSEGDGVKKDLAKAKKYYRLAANQLQEIGIVKAAKYRLDVLEGRVK